MDNSIDASQPRLEHALGLQGRPSAESPQSNVKSQQVKSQQLILVPWLKCPATLAESTSVAPFAVTSKTPSESVSTCNLHRHSVLAGDSFRQTHSCSFMRPGIDSMQSFSICQRTEGVIHHVEGPLDEGIRQTIVQISPFISQYGAGMMQL